MRVGTTASTDRETAAGIQSSNHRPEAQPALEIEGRAVSCLREPAHVAKVRHREALHRGELNTEILGEPLKHPGPPGFVPMSLEDGATDTPPQLQQLRIGLPLRLKPGRVNVLLQFLERGCVVIGYEALRHSPTVLAAGRVFVEQLRGTPFSTGSA